MPSSMRGVALMTTWSSFLAAATQWTLDCSVFSLSLLPYLRLAQWRSSFRVSSFLPAARLQTEQLGEERRERECAWKRIRTQHHARCSHSVSPSVLPLNERTKELMIAAPHSASCSELHGLRDQGRYSIEERLPWWRPRHLLERWNGKIGRIKILMHTLMAMQ